MKSLQITRIYELQWDIIHSNDSQAICSITPQAQYKGNTWLHAKR